MQGTPMLEMRGIVKRFPGVLALDKVDFSVAKGEIRGIVGSNGAGKSTLMKILSGMYHKDEGEIILNGNQIDIKSTLSARQLGLAFVYQEVDVVDSFTVAENLALGMEPTKGCLIDWSQLIEKGQAVLDRLGMKIDARTTVGDLSIAQKQMVAIARVMMEENQIVVFDEPTSRLAAAETEQLFALIRRLKAMDVAMIYVTQRLEEIFKICETITVMRNGQNVGEVVVGQCPMSEVVKMMVGTDLKALFPKRQVPIGEVLMRVENVCPAERKESASFEVRSGEIVGIYGMVGAGKTEMARAIFGIDLMKSGEIYLGGKKLKIRSTGDAIREGIALIPEERRAQGMLPTHGVHQNISLVSLARLMRWGLVQGKEEVALAERRIGDMNIRTPKAVTEVQYLSGGNQQKVVLGKWLSAKAKVYLLDEPTAGVDVGAKVEIYKLIEDLAEQGASIVIMSSDLDEVLGISDRVLVMRDGCIVFEAKPVETTQEEVLGYSLGVTQKEEEAVPVG